MASFFTSLASLLHLLFQKWLHLLFISSWHLFSSSSSSLLHLLFFFTCSSYTNPKTIATCKQESPPPPPPRNQPAARVVGGGTLGRVFGLLDQNGDGLVSLDEMSQGFQKLGVDLSRDQMGALLASYPLAKPGLLQLEEFEALYDSLCTELAMDDDEGHAELCAMADDDDGDHACEHDGLLEAFSVFDKNADGFISLAELQSVLCGLGFSECRDASFCRGIIQTMDSNGDGLVDFSEFKNMMLSSH